MFGDNLIYLRKYHKMSQEDLAEKLDVSRQTLSKWETGDSLPDIKQCQQLASIFDVSIDELVSYDQKSSGLPIPPKGKHLFGIVTVGDKGQIVIPARARKIFKIEPGDQLIVLGDDGTGTLLPGIAIVKEKDFLNMANIFKKKL